MWVLMMAALGNSPSNSCLAQAEGVVEARDIEYVYGMEESFNTNIQNLIVKWEGKGGEGGGVEGGEGGSNIGRRRSSEFIQKLQIFEHSHKTNDPRNMSFSTTRESFSIAHSIDRMRGRALLA